MLAQLARALAAMLEPLEQALTDPRRLEALLAAGGWVTAEPVDTAAVDAAARTLGVADDLRTLTSLASGGMSAAEALTAVDAGRRVLGRIVELAATDPASAGGDLDELVAALPSPFGDRAAVLAAIDDVGAALTSEWLQRALPAVHSALRATGVITGSAPERTDWLALLRLASDPAGALRDTTGWGGPLSLGALDRAVRALGHLAPQPVRVGPVDPVLVERHWGAGGTSAAGVLQYTVTVLDATGALTDDVALVLVPVPDGPGSGPGPTGVLLAPVARAGAAVPVTLGDTWSATVTVDADLTGTAGLVVRPSAGGGVRVVEELDAPPLGVAVTLAAPARRWVLGDPGGPRLELAGPQVDLGVRDEDGRPEPHVTLTAVDGISLVLAPPEGNGFLRFLLGDGAEVAVDVEIDVSTSGLRLAGSASLAFSVTLDLDVGPLHVDRLDVALAPGSDELRLSLVVAASVAIGPVVLAEAGLGAALALRPAADGRGTLGELDVALELLPPTLLVVTVESEAVTGGGFVAYDPETGHYAGGLALDVFGFGLSAIVIVDTELPGGREGWALFGSIGLEFATPIPLGFGFTLIGVGGLLALNRTLDVDGLAAGLRTGAADAILFPDDLERDADAVLAGLDTWFPALDGSSVFGPVVQIGWGSPTIVSAQLGVVVALPDLVVALLGSVEVLLPSPEDPVLALRMDVLGAVDVPAGTVVVAASLHDSNLLGVFELSGDMGFYLSLSGQPLFVLSVGGYHPQFDPPGALPGWLLDLRPTSAAIPLGESVEIVLTSYVAVTSNTLQFGGRFRLEASVDVLLTTYSAEGWFSIDVLLVLRPFKLVARATAGVSISAGDEELLGVDLAARLEGPEPWYASGRASFTFFGFDVDFGFEIGDRAGGEPREVHDVATDVVAALEAPGAWQPAEPGDAWGSGVVMGDRRPEGLWVRPDQLVEARQSVAPLNRTMTAFGEFTPAAARIEAEDVTLAGRAVAAPDWLDDWFAPAQFDRLGDSERLSSPSYELMTAGLRVGDDGIGITDDLAADCASVSREPEESIFPDVEPPPSGHVCTARPAALASATRSLANDRIAVVATTYTVVRIADGRRADVVLGEAGAEPALSYAAACAVVAGRAAAERSKLRVAPAHAAGEGVAA